MLRNYLVTAVRVLRRNFTYSLINIIGLALGLAGSFVISSWVWQELNYDTHFNDYERVHRVSVSFFNSGAFASGPDVIKSTLLREAPEVAQVTAINNSRPTKLRIGENSFDQIVHYADTNFFDVFQYELLQGDLKSAMDEPQNVVISDELAIKWFGTVNAIGKSLKKGDEEQEFIVSAIVKIPQAPSHLNAKIWFPLELSDSPNWTGAGNYFYVKLNERATLDDLNNRLELIRKELVYPSLLRGDSYEEWVAMNIFNFHAVSLHDIHLDPDMRFEMQPGGNKANVFVFLSVSIFLLLIAAINFINLSTALSIKRAKEVGIRKALGTSKFNLVFQYLIESLVLSSMATILAVGLAELFLILFENFTNEKLLDGLFINIYQLAFFVMISFMVGIIAGIYPAFYLSRFQVIKTLKGKSTKEGSYLRKSLVVLQFTISIIMISCSILVYQQLDFLSKVDIGLNRENVLVIKNIKSLGEQAESFRNELLSFSGVKSASFNYRMPASSSVYVYGLKSKAQAQSKGYQSFLVDDQFINTLGIEVTRGRNFSRSLASDSNAIILNESAVKELLLTEPIGKKILSGREEFHVVGVVRDFAYQSFYDKAEPTALMYNPKGSSLALSLAVNQEANIVEKASILWKEIGTNGPFNYEFLDDSYNQLLEKENTLGNTIGFFTVIALIVSVLGLLGLAAFMTTERRKEIGIRKVLGATVSQAIMLLNKSFSYLIVISLLISIPVSWIVMKGWLQNFQYRVDINPLVFVLAGLGSLIIAWFTIGYLTYNAASADPVKSLRDE